VIGRHRTVFAIIHGALAIALPLALMLMFGCFKLDSSGPDDLGPEVKENDVAIVVEKALVGMDPWKTVVGQQVALTYNVRIESQEMIIHTNDQILTILRREDIDRNTLKLTVHDFVRSALDGKVEESEGEQFYERSPVAAVVPASSVSSLAQKLLPTAVILPRDASDPAKPRVTYHNLHQAEGLMAPPPFVSSRPQCGGVANCLLRTFKFGYDEVTWKADGRYDVQRWNYTVSADAPFLAHVLELCWEGVDEYSGHRIFLKKCKFTSDFTY
jgi:hypothetical protein